MTPRTGTSGGELFATPLRYHGGHAIWRYCVCVIVKLRPLCSFLCKCCGVMARGIPTSHVERSRAYLTGRRAFYCTVLYESVLMRFISCVVSQFLRHICRLPAKRISIKFGTGDVFT